MKSMTIKEKSTDYLLALPDSSKKEKVLDNSDKWIDTRPKNVQSLSGDAESLAIIVTTLEQEMKENYAKTLIRQWNRWIPLPSVSKPSHLQNPTKLIPEEPKPFTSKTPEDIENDRKKTNSKNKQKKKKPKKMIFI